MKGEEKNVSSLWKWDGKALHWFYDKICGNIKTWNVTAWKLKHLEFKLLVFWKERNFLNFENEVMLSTMLFNELFQTFVVRLLATILRLFVDFFVKTKMVKKGKLTMTNNRLSWHIIHQKFYSCDGNCNVTDEST